MQPTENNKMDQLGRDAAENYQAPVAPNWDNFLPQLDKAMPQKEKKRRRFLLFWLLLGLTVGGAGTYIALKPSGTNQIATAPIAHNQPEAGPKPTNPLLKEAAVPQQQQSPASTKNTGSSKNAVTDIYTGTDVLPKTKTSSKSTVPEENFTNNDAKPIVITTTNTQQQKKKRTGTTYKLSSVKNSSEVVANATPKNAATVITNSTRVDTNTIVPETGNTVSRANNNNSNITTAPVTTIATDTSSTNSNTITKTSPVTAATVADSSNAITSNKKLAAKEKEKNTFSLAITGGLDWSTVKYDYAEPLGINIGVIGGYHLNKRWSIHTGLIYTQKKYEAKGEYFSPKDNNPWFATIKMMHLDGVCNMWEWPVYARYVLNPLKKQPFFISTGLSSYRLNKENYNYSYTYNTGTAVYYKNAVKTNKDIYLASILHLAAGTHFRAGKNLSILAEPYAKLPLRKMGYGNLMLSSFGINFSLQLKQPQKK